MADLNVIEAKLARHSRQIAGIKGFLKQEDDNLKKATGMIYSRIQDMEDYQDSHYVTRDQLDDAIERSDFQTFLWCAGTAVVTAFAVLLAVHYG